MPASQPTSAGQRAAVMKPGPEEKNYSVPYTFTIYNSLIVPTATMKPDLRAPKKKKYSVPYTFTIYNSLIVPKATMKPDLRAPPHIYKGKYTRAPAYIHRYQ